MKTLSKIRNDIYGIYTKNSMYFNFYYLNNISTSNIFYILLFYMHLGICFAIEDEFVRQFYIVDIFLTICIDISGRQDG